MNRKERRALGRAPSKTDKHSKDKIIEFEKTFKLAKLSVQEHTEPQEFEEGDKVMLNLFAIQTRLNYSKMNEEYKKFVEESDGKVFTAHFEHDNNKLVTLLENPRWLFWCGDLIKVKENTEEMADGKQRSDSGDAETENHGDQSDS